MGREDGERDDMGCKIVYIAVKNASGPVQLRYACSLNHADCERISPYP